MIHTKNLDKSKEFKIPQNPYWLTFLIDVTNDSSAWKLFMSDLWK